MWHLDKVHFVENPEKGQKVSHLNVHSPSLNEDFAFPPYNNSITCTIIPSTNVNPCVFLFANHL
jgi:hypothetical protein